MGGETPGEQDPEYVTHWLLANESIKCLDLDFV